MSRQDGFPQHVEACKRIANWVIVAGVMLAIASWIVPASAVLYYTQLSSIFWCGAIVGVLSGMGARAAIAGVMWWFE